jgi:hypothetical protein
MDVRLSLADLAAMHPQLLWNSVGSPTRSSIAENRMTSANAVSDMVVTVKSREVQRAMLAEMQGDLDRAKKHFLAAAGLEQVLADDYEQADEPDLARRSLISAASCFWRAGQDQQARQLFEALSQSDPTRIAELQEVERELSTKYPPSAA